MALRKIRYWGDPVLTKVCRPVDKVTEKIKDLVEDMFETMYDAFGVGLAAPQVGVLKRIVVIDAGLEEPDPHVLINPEIIEMSEETQTGPEGCLSVPGKNGATYGDHSGIAIETQHVPDAINQGQFRANILVPGRPYSSTTIYRPGVAE